MRAVSPLAAIAILGAALAAGCGNSRQHPPGVTGTQRAGKAIHLDYPGAGVRFAAPRNWYQSGGARPLVAVVASGGATVAVWRYRRSEPIPRSKRQLEQAQANLSDALRARGPSVRIASTKPVDVNRTRGIEVLATESVNGQARRVRSTHLFDRGAEIVIDAYAPPADFARVDATVFEPLLRSFQLRAPGSSAA